MSDAKVSALVMVDRIDKAFNDRIVVRVREVEIRRGAVRAPEYHNTGRRGMVVELLAEEAVRRGGPDLERLRNSAVDQWESARKRPHYVSEQRIRWD